MTRLKMIEGAISRYADGRDLKTSVPAVIQELAVYVDSHFAPDDKPGTGITIHVDRVEIQR